MVCLLFSTRSCQFYPIISFIRVEFITSNGIYGIFQLYRNTYDVVDNTCLFFLIEI